MIILSFRNRLFKTNLKVAFLPIIIFLVLIIALLGIYRHLYIHNFLPDTKSNSATSHMMTELTNLDFEQFVDSSLDLDSLEESFQTIGFHLNLLKDDTPLYLGDKHIDSRGYLSLIDDSTFPKDVPSILVNNRHLQICIKKEVADTTYLLIATSNNRSLNHFLLTGANFFLISIPMLILITLLICWLCSNYSKRLTRQLMLPILALGEGAKRIQEGNLEIPLEYHNQDEFSPVFDSFNNMQIRLKESILLSLDRERKQQEMVAEISHDLKTPLTAIKGYVKGLEDGIATTPEKQMYYLRKIHAKTDTMTNLIDEILMYSRLERNKIEFHPTIVCLDDYLTEIVTAIQEDYINQPVSITFHGNAKQTLVLIDCLQFNRVIENIIGNSYKYSNQPMTEITISTTRKENELTLFLHDNGPGVDEDKLPFIFDTFYRADDSRTNPTNGSGLGLTISKHIINQLSGTITAFNSNGLCIKINLPIYKGGQQGNEDIDH